MILDEHRDFVTERKVLFTEGIFPIVLILIIIS